MLCPRCKATFSEVVVAGFADRTRCPIDGWRLVVDRRGARLGPFAIDDFLGVGGGGSSVWVAREVLGNGRSEVERKIALKFLPWPEREEERHEVTRFERGAILAESLDHPHVAKVYAHGRLSAPDGELLWVSMALLEGDTLAGYAAKRKVVPAREAVELVDQVLSALEVAHAAGIVHRDLKPANLHVTPVRVPSDAMSGAELVPHVRVLDFGIARLAGSSAVERFGPFFPDDDPVAPELEQEVTGQHRICGTPEYMAPEQILGAPPDVKSDLYAVGVILYRLLTGQLPFRGRTRYELYHRHLHDKPPPILPSLSVPLPLEATMHRALSKKPEERFPDARAMRDALRESVGWSKVPRPRLFPTENELPRPERSVVVPALSLLPTIPSDLEPGLEPVIDSPAAGSTHVDALDVSTPRRRRGWIIWLAAAVFAGVGILVGASLAGEPPLEVGLTPTSSAR